MHRIVADVDTGIDDMLALIYLAGRHRMGEIELAGVTASAGNTTVCNAASNSRWILDLCGCQDIIVASGERAPIRVPLTTTPETHGEFGLGFARPPRLDAMCQTVGSAASLWERAIYEGAEKGEATDLLVTGPMTSVALHPRTVEKFRNMTVMGGAVNYPGNTTAHAEWNFWVDPDAAALAFEQAQAGAAGGAVQAGEAEAGGENEGAGAYPPVTLCHLGVTETITVTPADIERWGLTGDMGETVAKALKFYFGFHKSVGLPNLAQVHDLLAAMVALDAVEYETAEMSLSIDPKDRGAVVCNGQGPIHVVSGVDPEAVRAEFDRVVAFFRES